MPRENEIAVKATLDVSEFNRGIKQFVDGLNQLESQTQSTASRVNDLGNATQAGIGAAMGIAAVGAVNNLASSLTKLGKEVLTTLQFFEGLTFSLETMIALNMRASDDTLTMADALETATDKAQSYVLALQDIAIFSPFTTEEIGVANRLLQIYGIAEDEALGLTKLMTDLASVGGFGGERLARIGLAVGQIYAEGRLLARDALQLTAAGVPILRFIEDMTGKTTGEIQTMMRKGLLPASLAFEALVDGLRDFEGSGRRVATTAQGVFSSLKDIAQISLRDLFQGVFEGIRPFLLNLVNIGSSVEFRSLVTALGEELGSAVSKGVGQATVAISTFGKVLASLPIEIINAIAAFAAASAGLLGFGAAIGLAGLAINALINPITVVTAAVGTFAALFVAGQTKVAEGSEYSTKQVQKNFYKIIDVFGDITDIPKGLAKSMTFAADQLANAGNIIVDIFEKIGDAAEASSKFIIGLLSSIFDWGVGVTQVFASGIESGAGAVTSSLGFIGAVITGLLKPGSPPKLLPDLDDWGREAAEVWLEGWTDANFSALSDIGKMVQDTLKSLVSAGKLDEVSAVRAVIGSRQDISNAINEIRTLGYVTADTMKRVRNSAGPAAEEVSALLLDYTDLLNATSALEGAQAELNKITEEYDKQLKPLRKELERINELTTQHDEENEIMRLRRAIASEATSQRRKEQAQLKIQEILLGRQVRNLEDEKDAAVDAQQEVVDARKKEQDTAETALNLTQERIRAQNEQLRLYGEEIKALERLAKEMERLAKELREAFLKPFNDSIKRQQLLSKEISDTVALAKARYILAQAESSEAQKAAAAYNISAINAARAKRELELLELGVTQAEIDTLRNLNVSLSDIGVNTDALRDFASPDLSGVSEQFDELNRIFRESVENWKVAFGIGEEGFGGWLDGINDMLPAFLQFRSDAGGLAPLFKNLGAAFLGIVTIMTADRFIGVLSSLPAAILGVGTPLGWLVNLLGLFTAAWIGNWGDIRGIVGDAVDFINGELDSFGTSGGFNKFLPDTDEFRQELDATIQLWRGFGETLGTVFKDGIQGSDFTLIAEGFVDAFRQTKSALAQIDVFVDIKNQFENFISVLTDPAQLAAAFNTFVSNVRTGLADTMARMFFTDDVSLSESVARSIIQASLQFVMLVPIWVANFIDFVSEFIAGVTPTLGTLFDDFFGTIVPAALVWIGRATVIIGNSIGRFVLVALNLFFGELLPAFISNLPKMFGALVLGVKLGFQEIGNEFQQGALGLAALASGLIATYIGPNMLSAMQGTIGRIVRLMVAYVEGGVEQFVTDISSGLYKFVSIGHDVFNSFKADVRDAFRFATTTIQNFARGIVVGSLNFVWSLIRNIALAIWRIPAAIAGLSGQSKVIAAFRTSVAFLYQAFARVIEVIFRIPGAIARGFSSYFSIASRVLSTTGNLIASFANLSVAFTGVLGTGVLKTVQALEIAVGTVFSTIGKINLGQLFGGVKASPLRAVGNSILAIFDAIAATLGKMPSIFKFLLDAPYNFFKALETSLPKFFNTKIPAALISGTKTLFGTITTFFKTLPGLVGRGAGGLKGIFSTLGGDVITKGLAGGIKGIGAGFGNIGRVLKGSNLVRTIFSFQTLGKVLSGFRSILRGMVNPLSLIITTIDFFGFAFKKSTESADESIRGFSDNIRKLWADLISGQLFKDIIAGARVAFEEFREIFAIISEFGIDSPEFKAKLTEITTTIKEWVLDTGETIWNSIVEFWIPTFVEWIGVTINDMVTGLSSMINTLVGWIETGAKWIGDKIKDEWIPAFVTWWDEGGQEATVERLNNILDTIAGWIATSVTWIVDKLKVWIPAFVSWLGEVIPPLLAAAWQLLQTLIAWIGENAGPLATQLLTWATEFVSWLGPVVGNTIKKLGEWIGAVLKWIITDGIPALVKGVVGFVGALVGWISGDESAADNEVLKALGKFLGAILKFFVNDLYPALYDAGKSIVTSIWEGFGELWDETLEPFLGEQWDKAIAWIQETGIYKWIESGIATGQSFLDGIKEKIEGAKDFVQTIIDTLISFFTDPAARQDLIDGAIEWGKDMMLGIGQGIVDWVHWPLEKINEGFQWLINKGREAIDAHSPSQLFAREFGVPIATGVAEGIASVDQSEAVNSMSKSIVDAMSGVSGEAVNEVSDMRKAIESDFDDLYKSTRATAKDMHSDVSKSFDTMSNDMQDTMSEIEEMLTREWEQIHESSVESVSLITGNVVSEFSGMAGNAIIEANTMSSGVIVEFQQMAEDSVEHIDGMVTSILDALVNDENSLFSQISKLFTGSTSETNPGLALGEAIAQAIANGINSPLSQIRLFNALRDLIDVTLAAINEYLETGSPSEKFATEVGEPIALGIALGITRSSPKISEAIQGAFAGVSPAVAAGTAVFASQPSQSLPPSVTNSSIRTSNFNLTVNSEATSQGVIEDFTILQAMDS